MNEVLQRIYELGIIPVISIDDVDKAVPLARALSEGNLPIAEITFRTSAGEAAMRAISAQVEDMLLGAGTVLTCEQVDRAIDAGAKFIVSPGFNPEVVSYGLSKGIVMLPGTATGSEMEQAMAMGLNTVKFFPAEQNGGIDKLKALAGPYRELKWVPTGGINSKNLCQYLSFDRILACGGTWMAKKELIDGEKWDEISRICKEAVKTMLGLKLNHIGMNFDNADEAVKTAKIFCAMFDLPYYPSKAYIYSGTLFESMTYKARGTHGHIALGVNNVDRAVFQLKRRGVSVDEESRKRGSSGETEFIYIDGEVGGFAIHLEKN